MKIIFSILLSLSIFFVLPTQGQICNQQGNYFYNSASPKIRKILDGYIDSTGQLVPPCHFLGEFDKNGLAKISRTSKKGRHTWGLINKEGNFIIPITYRAITPIHKWYIVQKIGTCGLLNHQGQTILPFEYQRISKLTSNNGYTAFDVMQNDEHGVANSEGQLIIPVKYTHISIFFPRAKKLSPEEILYKVQLTNGSYKLLNGRGKAPFVTAYEDITPFVPPWMEKMDPKKYCILHKIKKKGKYGLINAKGKIVVPAVYNQLEWVKRSAYSRAFRVEKNGKWGILSLSNNKVLVPIIYESIRCFECVQFYPNHQRLFFRAAKNGKLGLVDISNTTIIPFAYDEIRSTYFESSPIDSIIYAGRQGQLWGFVDSKGQPITEVVYEEVSVFRNGLQAIKRNGQWGFINRQGVEVIAPQYDLVEAFSGKETHVRKDGQSLWIDLEGNVVRE